MRVLVTGGGTGIGRAVAAALIAAGHEAVIAGRREAVLRAAAEALGAAVAVGDVAEDPEALLRAAGAVDGLVNSAGLARHAPVGQWTAAAWDRHYAVHVRGPALLSQAFAEALEGPGAIVNVASTLGLRPAAGTAAYAASKAALLSLTRSLALELAGRQIRVNAVLPGVVPTAMTAGRLDALRPLHPMGRLGTPEEVADAVRWLLEAPWVTGAALAVDGGLLIG